MRVTIATAVAQTWKGRHYPQKKKQNNKNKLLKAVEFPTNYRSLLENIPAAVR